MSNTHSVLRDLTSAVDDITLRELQRVGTFTSGMQTCFARQGRASYTEMLVGEVPLSLRPTWPEEAEALIRTKAKERQLKLETPLDLRNDDVRGITKELAEDLLPYLLEVKNPLEGALAELLAGTELAYASSSVVGNREASFRGQGIPVSWASRIHLWEDGGVAIDGENYSLVLTMASVPGSKIAERIRTRFYELFSVPESKSYARSVYRRVFVLTSGTTGLRPHQLGTVGTPFEADNYDEATGKVFAAIATELKSPTPTARLSILSGPPGSGKSFFIRGLIESVEGALFLLVPAELVSGLGKPGMIDVLMQIKATMDLPIVLVLEDAEQALAPRMTDNIGHVAALLNFTDGMFGELLDLRVIATTNERAAQIDEALKRDGRLLVHHMISQPHAARACKVLSRLLDRELTEDESFEAKRCTSLASVYKLARKLGWKSDARSVSVNTEYSLAQSAEPVVQASGLSLGFQMTPYQRRR